MIKHIIKLLRNCYYRFYNQILYKCQIERNCDTCSSVFEGYNRISHHTCFSKGYIGRYSYIGANCMLSRAHIGRYTSIGNFVKVITSIHPISHVSTSPVFYSNQRKYSLTKIRLFQDSLMIKENSVIIGNDVWIGDNVLLKGGIEIGDGAIIAMGSVVTKDVPPYAVVGGVPAKIIKFRFGEDDIKWLLERRWWDADPKELANTLNEMCDINKYKEIFEYEDM